MRFRLLVATVLAAALSTATWILPVSAEAQPAGTLSFNGNSQATSQVPAGWDEPSGIAGSDGQLYLASQNPNAPTGSPDTTLSQSSDGVNWQENTAYYNYLSSRSDGQTGDVTMAADRAGTIVVGHLTGELQADIDWTRDDGKTWQTANDVATLASPGAASNSPGLVDRPWIGVYSPDTNYKDTQVYLEYHDFVTSAIYIVTCSMATGALACGSPVPVSNAQTACNSIPGGVAVSPPGSSHPGRVYTVWTTADPQTNAASGCNYTQLAPFYELYVAWSDTPTDPNGWHQVPIYIGPHGSGENCPATAPVGVSTNTCADMSELFTPVAVDDAGNVYVSFIDYIDTIDKHYDVYLERSTDGGSTWDGSTTGSGQPIMVSDAGGTHYTPNLTAGSAGRVAIVYYRTDHATRPYMNGDTCPTTVPPETSCQGKNQPEPLARSGRCRWLKAPMPTPSLRLSPQGRRPTPAWSFTTGISAISASTVTDRARATAACSRTTRCFLIEMVSWWPRGATNAWIPSVSRTQRSRTPRSARSPTTRSSPPRSWRPPSLIANAPAPPGGPGTPGQKRLRCGRASGRLSGKRLGLVALGMTRAHARHVFRHFSTRHRLYMDFFCLISDGIRAGYPSPRLLRSLRAPARARIRGRVILLLTASPYYALRGVRPGASLAAARRALRLTGPFHIGLNYWYLAELGASRGVLKVRHGVVEEVGVAYANLTRRATAFSFLKDFSNASRF